jgi:hypothetical protein
MGEGALTDDRIISIRASSLAGLFDCAYRWEGTHVLGLRRPASGAMALGTAIHKSTAVYDSARLERRPVKPDEAAGALVDHIRNPGEDVQWTDDDPTPKEAERIGLGLHTRYCTQVSPQLTFAAVELDVGEMTIDVPEQGVKVRLTGHLDRSRVIRGQERVRIADLKTGKRAASKDGSAATKGHGLQLGVYQILAEAKLGEPVDEQGEIIGLQTGSGAYIGRSTIRAPKAQVLGDENTPSLIEIAASMLRTGYFPPNPKSTTCGEKFCARWSRCPYRE